MGEDEYVETLLDQGVAGIILVPGLHADTTADHDRYQRLVERRLPLVLVNGLRAGDRRAVHLDRRPRGDDPGCGAPDSPLVAFTDPPLTTVRQPVQAMGTAAVRALLDAIAGRPVPSTEYVFRPELVVRGSTAAAPTPVPAGVPARR